MQQEKKISYLWKMKSSYSARFASCKASIARPIYGLLGLQRQVGQSSSMVYFC